MNTEKKLYAYSAQAPHICYTISVPYEGHRPHARLWHRVMLAASRGKRMQRSGIRPSVYPIFSPSMESALSTSY